MEKPYQYCISNLQEHINQSTNQARIKTNYKPETKNPISYLELIEAEYYNLLEIKNKMRKGEIQDISNSDKINYH